MSSFSGIKAAAYDMESRRRVQLPNLHALLRPRRCSVRARCVVQED
jgi:hypothetical protein